MLFGYTNIGGSLKIHRPYNLIQPYTIRMLIVFAKNQPLYKEHTSFVSGGVPLNFKIHILMSHPTAVFFSSPNPYKTHFRKLPNVFPRTENKWQK